MTERATAALARPAAAMGCQPPRSRSHFPGSVLDYGGTTSPIRRRRSQASWRLRSMPGTSNGPPTSIAIFSASRRWSTARAWSPSRWPTGTSSWSSSAARPRPTSRIRMEQFPATTGPDGCIWRCRSRPRTSRRWRTRLARREIALAGEYRWPRGGTSLYFRDPDGSAGRTRDAGTLVVSGRRARVWRHPSCEDGGRPSSGVVFRARERGLCGFGAERAARSAGPRQRLERPAAAFPLQFTGVENAHIHQGDRRHSDRRRF